MIRPTGADSWELEGVITDISADREAQNFQVASDVEVQQILTVADCLLWRAQAFQNKDQIDADWVLYIPRSNLYRRLFGRDPPST